MIKYKLIISELERKYIMEALIFHKKRDRITATLKNKINYHKEMCQYD